MTSNHQKAASHQPRDRRTEPGATRRGRHETGRNFGDLSVLMRGAQNDDAAAYCALLRECAPYAASIARRQGVPPAHVDDVVQETLLTVHRARATYDPQRPFLPWLTAIARHRAVDHMRRHAASAAREFVDEIVLGAQPDASPLACETLDRADRAARLHAAIRTLPSAQRDAVQRLGLMEMTLGEASALTARTTGAVKLNFHRGIHTLRTILGVTREARV